MFIGLFLFLMLIATIVSSESISSGIYNIGRFLVLIVLQNVLPKEEIKQLLSFDNNFSTWKLIGWVILLDLFVILPLHAAFTLLVFPDAEQQEVINLFKRFRFFTNYFSTNGLSFYSVC